MLIMPKKGYRVCLHCGKIMSTKQIKEKIIEGKKIKVCYNCGEPEKKSTGKDIISEYQARDLFNIVSMKGKEWMMTPEIETKYNTMYDNCLIPPEVRV